MSASMNIWITDHSGQAIKGNSQIEGRENSSNVLSIDYQLGIPYDCDTGQLTGVRKHAPFTIIKPIDAMSPVLMKACASGETLSEILVKLYQINEQGQEKEYFQYSLNHAKLVSASPIASTSTAKGDVEQLSFMFNAISWKFLEGNIETSDQWNATHSQS